MSVLPHTTPMSQDDGMKQEGEGKAVPRPVLPATLVVLPAQLIPATKKAHRYYRPGIAGSTGPAEQPLPPTPNRVARSLLPPRRYYRPLHRYYRCCGPATPDQHYHLVLALTTGRAVGRPYQRKTAAAICYLPSEIRGLNFFKSP